MEVESDLIANHSTGKESILDVIDHELELPRRAVLPYITACASPKSMPTWANSLRVASRVLGVQTLEERQAQTHTHTERERERQTDRQRESES